MLTVKTYLAPSHVHGIGLYAGEDISAQTIIWQYNCHIDRVFSMDLFLKTCDGLNDFALKHFLNSTYRRGGRYFYLTDNARFINHSEDRNNILFVDDFTEISLRDIKAGEELLENYLISYDPGDFFFHEINDPDPYHYIVTLGMQGSYSVAGKNISC